MDSTDEAVDHELRQSRLSRFGRVLALVTLGYGAFTLSASIWLRRLSVNSSNVPLLMATAAFAALWLLLRGAPRSHRFVRAVELSTLFVGTAAISTMTLVADLLAQPDMIVRTLLMYTLLAYAVYVPSTARHTLVVASLMTLPLLGCIFVPRALLRERSREPSRRGDHNSGLPRSLRVEELFAENMRGR